MSEYYDLNAEEFIASTVGLDLTHLYEPFLARVVPGGRILDVGCGSGRDAQAFAQRGFQVTAIDPSPAMVAATTERLGRPALLQRAEQIAWESAFDGIRACASLLHVPAAHIGAVFRRLGGALNPGGACCTCPSSEGRANASRPTGGSSSTWQRGSSRSRSSARVVCRRFRSGAQRMLDSTDLTRSG